MRTPALVNFARSGIRFTRAYTTMALCSPARTSIMTGLYPHAHKIVSNTHGAGSVSSEVSPKYAMWSEVLQRAGYRAGYVGKWDVGTLQAGELDGRPSPREPGGMHRWTPLDYGFREAVSAHLPYRADQLSHAPPRATRTGQYVKRSVASKRPATSPGRTTSTRSALRSATRSRSHCALCMP